MRKIIKIFRLLCCTALLVQFTSCELLDFEVDSDLSKIAAAMALNYDTIYVTPGTFIALKPTFDPDTLNTKDYLVWSSDTNVVSVNRETGRIRAEAPGWATLYAESVSAQLKDSCTVNVIPVWEAVAETYPYETIFLAEAILNGKPVNENMIVAAFVGDECRAIGEVLTYHDITFIQLRVGAEDPIGNMLVVKPQDNNNEEVDEDEEEGEDENANENDNVNDNEEEEEDDNGNIWDIWNDDEDEDEDEGGEEEPATPQQQVITFRCYDPVLLRLYECPVKVEFDGKTYGTLSKLYKITFK